MLRLSMPSAEGSKLMSPVDYIVIAVIAVVLGLAGGYIYKTKKSGRKCIGCPNSGNCSNCCSDKCGCHSNEN